MSSRLERVRSASFRVALLSTGITAIAFAVISVIIVMYVTNTLTAQVDSRLTSALTAVQNGQRIRVNGLSDPEGTPFGPALLGWEQYPDGSSASSDPSAQLPVAYTSISSPTTVSIGGIDVRVAGASLGQGVYVVVGQTLASVSQARSTIIVAELIVGGALLVVVFFGALAVGRRVGAPIELARQRQMEFTADASHELRTPLSVIEAQTSLALAQDREPAWYRQAFERVGGESKRIRRLVEDLLWLARADSTNIEERAEPVDVGVIARQATERFAAVAEARGVQLAVTAGADPAVVNVQSEWLDRLLGVLLDNACKYTPDHGRVMVVVEVDGGRARLVVEDSGPGIPSAERHRVFDRFHRASDAPGGAGLGLAIADTIVRGTHGRWEVATSRLGGARMAVSWPRVLVGGREPVRAALPEPPELSAQ